jgi:hypothetical protein
VTRYPGIAEYNQSAQNPATAFTDPELAGGTLATSALGLPIVLGGGFALTYTVSAKAQKFAVRCFHRYVPDLKERYAQISDAISGLRSKHFVAFEYQRKGVRVRSELYPVVKMAWAEGPTLGAFIEDNYDDAAAMRGLMSSFHELARFLADRGIAHGDLENGNMVVRNGALTLIDYDGMYVPAMARGNGNELGHAHFQHPGRTPDHFGPRIDDFSFIMIDISLDAIARDPTLYERYCTGDNILFQRSDFENPGKSPLFQELRRIGPLAGKVDDFAKVCRRRIKKVPSFEKFLDRHGRPEPPAVRQTAPAIPAGARPQGMSNLDYIRSSLGQGASGPTPSGSRLAASNARAGQTRIPRSDGAGNQTSNWLWWLEVFMVVMMLTLILLTILGKF